MPDLSPAADPEFGQAAGVSPAPLLVRQDYVGRYRSLLDRHLPPDFQQFAGFFADMTRLETMAGMLRASFPGTGRSVLNAGCGPFASEIFVAALQGQRITSFDYTAEFAPFFEIFRNEGVLGETSFALADAMKVEFEPRAFDLIVMHDLLYEPALDLDRLLQRYRSFLAPGGLVYFDYMNRGVRWLWVLLGKEKSYRRYTRGEIAGILARHGFEIVDQRPARPAGGGAKMLLHRLLTKMFRTSNAFAVVARLKGGR